MSARSGKKVGLPEAGGEVLRFKCVCAYDGTDYCGWQSQPKGTSLQDFIEGRLKQIFKRLVRIHGSGRTDAGVHANAQVFHFDAPWNHGTDALHAALKCGHRDSIRILSVEIVPQTFHARYSVRGKRYVYHLCEGVAMPDKTRYVWSLGKKTVDVSIMAEAAKMLLGTHDFTAFSASRNTGRDDPVKTLYRLDVKRRGREITITTEGSGYMYKMVRMIVGGLTEVGCGKLSLLKFKEILESKKRGGDFCAAPSRGLFLDKVYYSRQPKARF